VVTRVVCSGVFLEEQPSPGFGPVLQFLPPVAVLGGCPVFLYSLCHGVALVTSFRGFQKFFPFPLLGPWCYVGTRVSFLSDVDVVVFLDVFKK